RRGRDGAALGGPALRPSARPGNRTTAVPGAAQNRSPPDPGRAAAPPADAPRRHRVRMLQRAVDVGRVPALGSPVSLRQRGDRPVRTCRARGGDGGAGRRPDAGRGREAMSAAIVLLLLSWGVLAFGKTSVVALIVGIVVLDLGAQAMHIS